MYKWPDSPYGCNRGSDLYQCGNPTLDIRRYIYSEWLRRGNLFNRNIIKAEFECIRDRILNLCLRQNNINSVFVAFKASVLEKSHLLSFSRSGDRLDWIRCKSEPAEVMWCVSSAYFPSTLNDREANRQYKLEIKEGQGSFPVAHHT